MPCRFSRSGHVSGTSLGHRLARLAGDEDVDVVGAGHLVRDWLSTRRRSVGRARSPGGRTRRTAVRPARASRGAAHGSTGARSCESAASAPRSRCARSTRPEALQLRSRRRDPCQRDPPRCCAAPTPDRRSGAASTRTTQDRPVGRDGAAQLRCRGSAGHNRMAGGRTAGRDRRPSAAPRSRATRPRCRDRSRGGRAWPASARSSPAHNQRPGSGTLQADPPCG